MYKLKVEKFSTAVKYLKVEFIMMDSMFNLVLLKHQTTIIAFKKKPSPLFFTY